MWRFWRSGTTDANLAFTGIRRFASIANEAFDGQRKPPCG